MYRHDVIDTAVTFIHDSVIQIIKGFIVSPFIVGDNLNPSHTHYRAPPATATVPIKVLSS
jgi:hypothetical protein